MKKIDCFTNQYPLSKTLRFRLIPVGKTQENFDANKLLEEDKKRAENYTIVKHMIDEFHRFFIDDVLDVKRIDESKRKKFIDDIKEYDSLYGKQQKTDAEIKKLSETEEKLRKQIVSLLTGDERYKMFWGKEMITDVLPLYFKEESEKAVIDSFNKFTTYFYGFFENRANIYTAEDKSTGIAHRCINDNLPKFLDNAKIFKAKEISNVLKDKIELLDRDFKGIYDTKTADLFNADSFIFVLSQEGIERYNNMLGGFVTKDGKHIQGLNQYINLYNQQVAKEDKSKRIPVLKTLYKQILSERSSISFIPEKFNTDGEVIDSIKMYFAERENEKGDKVLSVKDTLNRTEELINGLEKEDLTGIFVKNGLDLTAVSRGAFGAWDAVKTGWEILYDAANTVKNTEKYYDDRDKKYKKCESFSLAETEKFAKASGAEKADEFDVLSWLKKEFEEKCSLAIEKYNRFENGFSNNRNKKLQEDGEAKELIKECLDYLKDVERFISLLLGTGKEENKNEDFYGRLLPLYERISEVDGLYDKTRNYLTQKPYKTEKIKLNFANPQFLGGWDENKEGDYSSVLLKKDGSFYLAVMSKNSKNVFDKKEIPEVKSGEPVYEKMIYKLLPDPKKMLPKVIFSKKNVGFFEPSDEILEIYNRKMHIQGESFDINACRKLIDYFKICIAKHPDWSKFGFVFSDTNEYSNIGEFYKEVKDQGYNVKFVNVPVAYVNERTEKGDIYLFKLYNKDFSQNSKGTPNLHTVYFKSVFESGNLNDTVYALNGKAEMFIREASIERKITHAANVPIKNKNKDNAKKESVFGYGLIKDRRYTENQFFLHIPVTMNFKADGKGDINIKVRKALKENGNNHVIGIDRGERNLLYISVVDGNGVIKEQLSLNDIVNEYKGTGYKTDYHALLDEKERERLDARKNWTAIENIKELKEGYISQVLHILCELVEKYDAVIAMEDLNFGFKTGRSAVEKSVYQKFEKMLIDKLNFYVNKKKDPDEVGGAMNAYQLTNKFESFKRMGKQNGIIFYVPAWLTSKIDPTTGFADLLKPKYTNVSAAKDFVKKFDSIKYNAAEGYFEFDVDYGKFPNTDADHNKKWTVCTYGNRIKTFRNPEKNSEWDSEEVCLTDEYKKLFAEYGIDTNGDLKEQIVSRDDAGFFKQFIYLLKLTLQMRNSKTGTDIDYLISPVKNAEGKFYFSDEYKDTENAPLPKDADANGAYNIARKALWAIEQIKNCEEDLYKVKLAISNKEWLEYAQTNV